MSDKYCIFLRGINVKGTSIKMDALKEAFKQMGFPDAKTVLASGNVIVSVPEGNGQDQVQAQELKALIEKGLSEYFGYDAHVVVRREQEIKDILAAAQAVIAVEGYHKYLILGDDQEVLSELQQLFNDLPHTPGEQLVLAQKEGIWVVSKGSTLDSPFGSKVLGAAKYKSRLTSRNVNTIEKVDKAMKAE